ncbi:hypothetical protein Ahy_B02g058098 [Arachis hypogaea]|uniref:pectinesterase n=1 Tax=Arachis hypogaea TaxID=3818 RepID=A0A445ADV2_ARAHY|nr:hypothetical protein Ahy_B02g058098 [Arachis hypogaea]
MGQIQFPPVNHSPPSSVNIVPDTCHLTVPLLCVALPQAGQQCRKDKKSEGSNTKYYRTVGDKILPFSKIIVDSFEHGNFSTIQSAIDFVPSNNKYWVSINVKAGIYREKVTIPSDKPYIILKGTGKKKTWVEWGDHNTTAQSPTFQSMADNIVVKSISFRNTYNNPINTNLRALCQLDSLDCKTLYEITKKDITTNFILFKRCSINVIGGPLKKGFVGYITAQGRTNSNGFVFKNYNVFGNDSTFLGRPWRSYTRVLFYNTNMANIIQLFGITLCFFEYGNFGSGSDTSKRVNWIIKLDLETINMMTSMNFIDSEGWLHHNQRF